MTEVRAALVVEGLEANIWPWIHLGSVDGYLTLAQFGEKYHLGSNFLKECQTSNF